MHGFRYKYSKIKYVTLSQENRKKTIGMDYITSEIKRDRNNQREREEKKTKKHVH